MKARQVYPSLFAIGVAAFFVLLAAGGYESVSTNRRPPPIYLNYSKEIETTITKQKNDRKAIEQLLLAVKLDFYGHRPKHFFELAKAAYRTNDLKNQQYALRSLRQMVEAGTIDDPRIHYYLAVALILQNEVSRSDAREAIKLCHRTLSRDPNFAPAHSNMGVAWVMLAEPDKARPRFLQALRLDPTLEQAQQGMQYLEHGGSPESPAP